MSLSITKRPTMQREERTKDMNSLQQNTNDINTRDTLLIRANTLKLHYNTVLIHLRLAKTPKFDNTVCWGSYREINWAPA